jgi:hypothetical protein
MMERNNSLESPVFIEKITFLDDRVSKCFEVADDFHDASLRRAFIDNSHFCLEVDNPYFPKSMRHNAFGIKGCTITLTIDLDVISAHQYEVEDREVIFLRYNLSQYSFEICVSERYEIWSIHFEPANSYFTWCL